MALARKNLDALKENPLVLAAIISLAVHLSLFGGWKLGQRLGWWQSHELPGWLQKVTQSLTKLSAPKQIPPPVQSEVPLIFVDVNPQLAVKEPPKETKFYGAANTQAASEKRSDDDLPEIKGKQDRVIKTTDDSKSTAQPLQPTPAPSPDESEREEKSRPKEKEISGDLALAKPQEKKETDDAEAEKRVRPRKLSEVKPSLLGEKLKQQGGAKRLALEPAFDVKVTSFGDYDREFIAAVQQRWYELLEGRNTVPGKVVLEFRLNYDGRITDLKLVGDTTHNLMLELICKSAIDDPAPYRKWPTEMRRELKSDSREVRFTFYYQ
jgi:hypothetical protein